MQTGYTGYIDQSEWRWTTLVALTFLMIAFSPFVIVALNNPIQSDFQFMGVMHDTLDSASQIARMQQGADGNILLDFVYSPQPQDTALVHPLYAILGQLTRYSQLSPNIMYHVIRIFVSMFMFFTIYYLGANIWVKIRTRRIFFIMASVGAGLGWLVAILANGASDLFIPDLHLPQAFPIYAGAVNIHYPLAIACLALVVSVIVGVMRPGETENPSTNNHGPLVFIASLVLAITYPEALIPLGLAFALTVTANWLIKRQITAREFYWGLWILVPALPIITYDILAIVNNPFVASWIEQRARTPINPLILVLSFGILLLVAIPGLIRAVRRFEPDGDRFMLLWLFSMTVTLYLPMPLKQYLLIGAMLPVAYFATRAIEDFWLRYVRRKYRSRLYVVFLPSLVISHIFWIFLPIYPLLMGWEGFSTQFLEQDYSDALVWLDQNTDEEEIVLASPTVSVWIPPWTGNGVVYGHPAETFNAEYAYDNVVNWYQQTTADSTNCMQLLRRYNVAYVIFGPRERQLGPGACVEQLAALTPQGELTMYRVPPFESIP